MHQAIRYSPPGLPIFSVPRTRSDRRRALFQLEGSFGDGFFLTMLQYLLPLLLFWLQQNRASL